MNNHTTISHIHNSNSAERERERERDYSLDYLRILACLMVVATHSALPQNSPTQLDSIFLSTWSYINAPCIGIFFMISGALLLPSKVDSYKDFFSHRLSKIIYPTIFWSIIYLSVNHFSETSNFSATIRSIFSIPFSAQGNGVMWYMYTLIGLYLLIPILSPWLRSSSRKQELFYITIWCITLLYPYISQFLSINQSNTGIFYYLSGYIGYFLLGSFMARHMTGCKNIKLASTLLITATLIPVPFKLLDINVDFYSMFWYLSMPVAIMCLSWFILSRNIPAPTQGSLCDRIIRWISPLTFGIYLSHILFRKLFHSCFADMPVATGTLLTTLCMLTSAIILCEILKRLPLSQYTIGIKQTK